MILELNQPQYLICSLKKNYRFNPSIDSFRFSIQKKRMDYEKMVMRISYK